MGKRDFEEVKRQIDKLSQLEKLKLLDYLAGMCRLGAQKRSHRRKWSEIRGTAPYPLTLEDAQDWISRTRAESDANRHLG
ncbi:MAG: hypothetical protein MUC41_03240 [Syntrophobacteraceae bacterium]|jgi:hypothetical protein|nr:hypothetical protein [Syntrophobacteraceae bacterium]